GFIGGEPAPANSAKAAPQQRAEAVQADASDKLLPDKPISVSRLDWADIHMRYRGGHIEGRNMGVRHRTGRIARFVARNRN
ncbi:MAG: hypothetical protein QOF90_642, partial [Acetobacteraceae bacterium]|nr:hypothetical protein [Acetobacteraceae bacterium]